MSVALNSESLLDLAKSRSPADRERLLLGVVELCEAGSGAEAVRQPQVQASLNSIFLSLVVEAEREIRQKLASKLAHAEWAPPALINVLALDEIEIARPVIAASPVLKDHDLIRLLVEATIEHQIEVARRPRLGAPVVAAILKQAEPAVLAALAGNGTAELSEADMMRLVDMARQVAALRSPLSRHPKLTGELALQLYVWVGQALRQALVERFRLDSKDIGVALAASVAEAHGGVHDSQGLLVVARDGEREAMERRLIDKLHAAGQLRPGYLVRALREGRLSLFCTTLAILGRFEAEQVRRAVDSDRPEILGLACAAVGIDRSVFPSILHMVRELNGGRPGGGAEGARRAVGAFGPVSPQVAGAAFRQAAKGV
ncbi:DUF2336 domain-containing protein [Phenylobacterium sp.]|uniref:DUF2336 domain-containing protein n=1 Tax=Phenylobacterium sp. TaxID=1871053 RepID=UPI00261F4AF4|nr:DUF2336 domain-containing protein [Phenylobacterium sp.]